VQGLVSLDNCPPLGKCLGGGGPVSRGDLWWVKVGVLHTAQTTAPSGSGGSGGSGWARLPSPGASPPASRNHHNGRNRKRYSNVLGSLGSLVRLGVLKGAYRDPKGLGRCHGVASVICG